MPKVYFIGAGPGDPELLTLKGRRILDEAEVVIYAGSLVNPALLEGLRAEIYNSAGMSLEEIIEVMKVAIGEGKTVARLHTGDPGLYSAISEQIEELKKLGIEYEVVPGVTSASAAASTLGQELTIPEKSQTVILTRRAGRTPVPEREALYELATHQSTMVIFLSVSMIDAVVDDLKRGGYPEETPVAVVYRASWPDEKVIRGTLKDIARKVKSEGINRTALIVVGEALKVSMEELGMRSRLYDSDFKHGYRGSQGKNKRGKLWVVGIGPGGTEHITPKARDALQKATLVVGYTRYMDLIRDLIAGKQTYETGMTREIDRCRYAIKEAAGGKEVALVCSGDPGIYAMAGLVYEILRAEGPTEAIDVEVIPGIPALSACASLIGAPLMHDFASISLSDRLTPWEVIERRLHAAASADFVMVIYNPRSKGRAGHLKRAIEIISSYRRADTPVGVVKAATRKGEEWIITTLSDIPYDKVDMNTTLIIGNSSTYIWQKRMITPRGYEKKYDLFKT